MTPPRMRADAVKILNVIGSPRNMIPVTEPKTPAVDRSIATWVALVYCWATACITRVRAKPMVPV